MREHEQEARELVSDYEKLPEDVGFDLLLGWLCRVVMFLLIRYINED